MVDRPANGSTAALNIIFVKFTFDYPFDLNSIFFSVNPFVLFKDILLLGQPIMVGTLGPRLLHSRV